MADVSIFLPYLASRPGQLVPYMALVQNTAACRLWIGQHVSYDPYQGIAFGSGLGLGVPVGTAVTLLPLRHPFEAAMQARGLALTTGHPAIAGYGVGGRAFQQATLGRPYASPLSAVREYFHVLRRLLDGEPVRFDGEYITMHGGQGAPAHPGVQLGLGVLRPRMAELAGEISDVAITWLAPPAYVRDVLAPHLEKGATRAGRDVPRLVCALPVALQRPGRDLAALVQATNGRHLQAEHYADMLRQAGLTIDADDPQASATALLEAGAFAYGGREELADRAAAYHSAGADEVALYLASPSTGQAAMEAVEELRAVVTAVTAR